MAAPQLTFTTTWSGQAGRLSAKSGYDHVTVSFSSDIAYQAFECRATKAGAAFGRGVGKLVASFSATPANTARSFDVYDDDLIAGDGAYRISLYAEGADGSWNDNAAFIPSGYDGLTTSDSLSFLCMN